MTFTERIQLRRADEQCAATSREDLVSVQRDPWDVRNVRAPRRVSLAGVRCPCGEPARKRGACHRCYMRARRAA